MQRIVLLDDYADFKRRLNSVFKLMRQKHGVVARQNFACCGSCGSAELAGKDYIFYHRQDTEDIGKELKVYVAFAYAETAYQLKAIAEAAGLQVIWNGQQDTRVLLSHASNV